ELDAAAGARAVVRIERRVAFGRERLRRERIAREPPLAVVALRSAVHDDHERIALPAPLLERPDQEPFELEAVARAVADRLLHGEVAARQVGVREGQPAETAVAAPCEELGR